MSHKDNQDLRQRELGGWFWAEHELFTTFAPLIGPLGVSVYIAMARLIPLIQVDPYRYRMSVRFVMQWSCVGRDKTAELIRTIVKLGMVSETRYTDGRENSYSLMSLRDLAKVGEAELKQRIGVRSTDTAPFDQSVKNAAEKERRKKKAAQTALEEGQERELPLLDDSQATAVDGVRTADTRDGIGEAPDGVRTADTVSATEAHVSAQERDVSAQEAHVSATAAPFNREKKREEINPLPPAEQGDEGLDSDEQARPVLPVTDCTIADAGFRQGLPIAAQWAMARLGITKRRLGHDVERQLETYCRNNRNDTLEEAAALLVQQGIALHRDAALLTLTQPWGWSRFINEGHWSRPLPYRTERRHPEATIGQHDPEQTKRVNAQLLAKVREYIDVAVTKLSTRVALSPAAEALRALAESDDPTDGMDTVFDATNGAVEELLLAGYDESDRELLEEKVSDDFDALLKRYRGLPRDQYEATKAKLRRKHLFAQESIEELSVLHVYR